MGETVMDDDEIFKATMARAEVELKAWTKQNLRPMSELSAWDSEDEVWVEADAEVDLAYELQDEFGDQYPANIIETVAGQLVCDYGDWGRP